MSATNLQVVLSSGDASGVLFPKPRWSKQTTRYLTSEKTGAVWDPIPARTRRGEALLAFHDVATFLKAELVHQRNSQAVRVVRLDRDNAQETGSFIVEIDKRSLDITEQSIACVRCADSDPFDISAEGWPLANISLLICRRRVLRRR